MCSISVLERETQAYRSNTYYRFIPLTATPPSFINVSASYWLPDDKWRMEDQIPAVM